MVLIVFLLFERLSRGGAVKASSEVAYTPILYPLLLVTSCALLYIVTGLCLSYPSKRIICCLALALNVDTQRRRSSEQSREESPNDPPLA